MHDSACSISLALFITCIKCLKGVGELNASLVIIGIVALIVLLLIVGAPLKPIRWFMHGSVKVVIGVLCLFFFNVFGASFGMHLPINIYNAGIIGFLGIPGFISLTALHLFIFS